MNNKNTKSGEKVEKNALNYLMHQFGNVAIFDRDNVSDSTTSDIKVKNNNLSNKNSFFIEVKDSSSQCGQFVLKENLHKRIFEFSHNNKSDYDKNTKQIIDYMNNNFNEYALQPKSKKIKIKNNQEIFASWIINHYRNLDVKFIITPKNKSKTTFYIIRLKDILNFFNIEAYYRKKRSGSNSISKSKIKDIETSINLKKIGINNLKKCYDKHNNIHLIALSKQDLTEYNYSNNLVINNKTSLYFSNKSSIIRNINNGYEIRTLSNTKNKNVIFRIKQKNNIISISNKKFIQYLKN